MCLWGRGRSTTYKLYVHNFNEFWSTHHLDCAQTYPWTSIVARKMIRGGVGGIGGGPNSGRGVLMMLKNVHVLLADAPGHVDGHLVTLDSGCTWKNALNATAVIIQDTTSDFNNVMVKCCDIQFEAFEDFAYH